MKILGLDPGFDRLGFGLIEDADGKMIHLEHGCILTDAKEDFSLRLQCLRDELVRLIKKTKPDVAAVEQLFFQTNAKTAIKVGMARGVILLALRDADILTVDVTPSQVKQGVAGWGKAGKKQIQEMVKRLLLLREIPKPDDAADALALAIVGSSMARFELARGRSKTG